MGKSILFRLFYTFCYYYVAVSTLFNFYREAFCIIASLNSVNAVMSCIHYSAVVVQCFDSGVFAVDCLYQSAVGFMVCREVFFHWSFGI